MRRRTFEKAEAGSDIKRPETVSEISVAEQDVVIDTSADAPPVGADRSVKEVQATEASGLSMPSGFQRIITHQFQAIDEYEEFLELRKALRFNGRASALGYGELLDALDTAEDFAHRGAELVARANVAHVEFELDAKIILGSLRTPAIEKLNAAKAALKLETKTNGKQITNEDVDSVIAQMFPDEWATLESRRARARESVKLYGDLAERLVERARDLRTMVGKSRAVE